MEVITRIKKQEIKAIIQLLLLRPWSSNVKLNYPSSASCPMGYSEKSWKPATLSNKKLVQKHPHF